MPTLLTHKSAQDLVPPVTAINWTPEGEVNLSYTQELSLSICGFLVTVFIGAAALSAMVKLERKLHDRMTRCIVGLGEHHSTYEALRCIVYRVLDICSWVILLLAIFGLLRLLQVTIRAA